MALSTGFTKASRTNLCRIQHFVTQTVRCKSDAKYVASILRKGQTEKGHPEVPRKNREYVDATNPDKGLVWGNKPFKITLEAGKRYAWCSCGYSHSQPFCDGSHKTLALQNTPHKAKNLKPHRFMVEETKEYWLCNCKQTDNRPFCDGSHKNPDLGKMIKGANF